MASPGSLETAKPSFETVTNADILGAYRYGFNTLKSLYGIGQKDFRHRHKSRPEYYSGTKDFELRADWLSLGITAAQFMRTQGVIDIRPALAAALREESWVQIDKDKALPVVPGSKLVAAPVDPLVRAIDFNLKHTPQDWYDSPEEATHWAKAIKRRRDILEACAIPAVLEAESAEWLSLRQATAYEIYLHGRLGKRSHKANTFEEDKVAAESRLNWRVLIVHPPNTPEGVQI